MNDTLVLIPILALAQASSPLFGKPPFYGYTWVFYADLAAGVLAGLLGARLRARGSAASLSITWYIAGGLFGGVAGGAVFLPFYLMNALFSVGFGAMAPALMFGLTLAVILLTVASVMLARRRG